MIKKYTPDKMHMSAIEVNELVKLHRAAECNAVTLKDLIGCYCYTFNISYREKQT